MLKMIKRITYKISPHYFGFFGGVLIATAIDLFISILGIQNFASKNMTILSSISIFFSGFFCTWIGWKTDLNLRTSIEHAKNYKEKEEFLNSLIERDANKISGYLVAAIVLAIIGFGVIAYVAV